MRANASDATWPERHERTLTEAYASVPCGESWCLFSYARDEMSFDEMATQHSSIVDGLGRADAPCGRIRVQTTIAHYRTDTARTRLEPWLFAAGKVRVELAAWFCSRFQRPVAFWGDRASMFALAPDGDRTRAPWGATARSLGPFRTAAIAQATQESAPKAAAFLGFDGLAPTFYEALLRLTLPE